eukprot:TRINITY_DN2182_c0_g1_i1.p1 TRINITY_DN2182_c0_g1~~TRINITY_DN2182_c0_g1_i1.p1  ORF type:complete len:192 (-),score=15.98 TRINITY_DN2182_c0_g1_i1:46-621(-)
MSMYMINKIKSFSVSTIKCPHVDCTILITHNEVRRCLSIEEFTRYESFLVNETLKTDPNARWCPRPSCGIAMIGDPVHPCVACPNPSCRFKFCFNCKDIWHVGFSCQTYMQQKHKNNIDEYWKKDHTKPCPKCKAAIEKDEGCNHMKCENCKFQFCWLCRQSVLDHNGKYKSGHWALYPNSPCYQKMHSNE